MYEFSLSLRQCKKTDSGGARPSLLTWLPREAQSVAGVRLTGSLCCAWDGDWEGGDSLGWGGPRRWNAQQFSLGYLACALLPGSGRVKSGEMRKNPKPENSHTCPQVCGWPVPVPWTCAAVLGFAGLSLFLMVDRDALFKEKNNRNENLHMKTRRPSGSLSTQ